MTDKTEDKAKEAAAKAKESEAAKAKGKEEAEAEAAAAKAKEEAEAEAAAAKAKEEAEAEAVAAKAKEEAPAPAEGVKIYRVKYDFHDTTTGTMRKAGRTLRATPSRAKVLDQARVLERDADGPVEVAEEDEDDHEGEESVYTLQEAASERVRQRVGGHVAPVNPEGPVDEAVAIEVEENGAEVLGGMKTSLTAENVPDVISGRRSRNRS